MDNLLQKLTTKKQRLDAHRPLPEELVKNLNEWFKIELTYTSNAIEGNTLSRAETALVVEKGITVQGKNLKEHLEATNHVEALEYIKALVGKTRKDITKADISDINKLILNKTEGDSGGRYRTMPARLTGSATILPNPIKIPELMEEFVTWLHGDNSVHPSIIAADAHFRLVSIHPFPDGNGRTSRLLMNLILMQEGYPPAIIRKEDRATYINSLEKGQATGSLEDFHRFVYEAVDRSLDIYLEALEPERMTATVPSEQRFFTTDEVATLLQIDRESVRRYVRSGKLKAVKLGGRFIRIEKADLDKFIEGMKNL